MAIVQWIWPTGRCQNCQSIYSTSLTNINDIKRLEDERLTTEPDVVDGILVDSKRNSIGSQYSSSDDGGFLPKRSRTPCPSWRRPLVNWPSELSFRSDGQSSNRWLGLSKNLLQTIPQLHRPPTSLPITENLHINTISANVPMISVNNLHTPSRLSRIHASSPATSSPLVNSPWSPLYFSDLSSVHPLSAERSNQIFSPNYNRLQQNSKNPRYVNELPSRRVLDDSRRMPQIGFIPVQHFPSPTVKSYYANIRPPSTLHNHPIVNYRSRNSSRSLRAPPELSSPLLNLNLNILEQSPESQSSSSGFGSKNTSSNQNQSSQLGAHDWRLPPYRSPPQASKSTFLHSNQYSSYQDSPSSLQYSMSQWLDLMQRLNSASSNDFKAVDVGSVDGHYEVNYFFAFRICT